MFQKLCPPTTCSEGSGSLAFLGPAWCKPMLQMYMIAKKQLKNVRMQNSSHLEWNTKKRSTPFLWHSQQNHCRSFCLTWSSSKSLKQLKPLGLPRFCILSSQQIKTLSQKPVGNQQWKAIASIPSYSIMIQYCMWMHLLKIIGPNILEHPGNPTNTIQMACQCQTPIWHQFIVSWKRTTCKKKT